MKVQCNCGSKYAIDVTPEMARDPIRFVCPSCDLDLSGPINDLVRQELGVTPAATPSPEPPAATAAPAARMRVASSPGHAAAPAHAPVSAAAPVALGKLSISRGASTATHGTATETAPQPGGGGDEGQPCTKH